MTDLQQLRAWRSAEPGRAIALRGLDGRDGVKLVLWANGDRFEAAHDSVSGAAIALASGATPFRKVVSPPSEAARRAGPGRPRNAVAQFGQGRTRPRRIP